MLTASELKRLLQAHGLRLTKRLGQHHLVDARCIERLVTYCELMRRDTVVEIGAGLGALTEPLARRAGRVIAVEADHRIAALLAERLRAFENVAIVCQDILTYAWQRTPGAVAVGAIPYHITSPLLVSLWQSRALIREAWLLVQLEVARRLVAEPGTKAYGRLSVLCQSGWQLWEVMTVPRSAFFPRPTVDSSWVHLVPRRQPAVAPETEALFFEVVKAAFGQRRKTLVNGLIHARLTTRAQAVQLLKQLGLPEAVRGEALSLQQFASIAELLGRENR